MGVGGALCALIAAGVSLTLLPALLGMLGERVNAGGPRRWKEAIAREARAERSGFWYRHSQRVMRHPVPVATGAAVLLLALGAPLMKIQFTGIDPSVLPSTNRRGSSTTRSRPSSRPARRRRSTSRSPRGADLRVYSARLPAPVAPPRIQAGRIDLIAPGPPLGEAAKDFVRDVRAVDAPFEVKVGGQTAGFVDQQASLRPISRGARDPRHDDTHNPVRHDPLGRAPGEGAGHEPAVAVRRVRAARARVPGRPPGLALQFDSQGAIESSQPVLLFAVAFGLSTDYGVFLLGRIKELHDQGLSNEEAVALGLQRTGRIVTFAALLMVIAIGCFVTASIIFIKQLGFGVAVAVLIDATIVRALLVPALMRLLGDWNWWVPRPLARLLPA